MIETGTNPRILRVVLDLARTSSRNSSSAQKFCRSNLIPRRLQVQAFWQPIGCPGQLDTRSWDQKTYSWLSHSHHWVCRGPEHSRLLFSCWCLKLNLLKPPFPGKGWSAQLVPHPPWKRPHSLHQKPLISTRGFMLCRVGVVNWAVLFKKKHQTMGMFSIQQWRFKSFFMDLRLNHPTPCPTQNRVCRKLRLRRSSGV